MSPEMMATVMRTAHIDVGTEVGIRRFRWKRPTSAGIVVSVWIACQGPLVNELLKSTVPYMDACLCVYHDHDALSCLKVRKAISLLESLNDAIWLMSTDVPKQRIRHKSRIKKFYNKDGFERPLLTGTLSENIEQLLKVDLKVLKQSY